ncbi:MAG: hypothetical protein HHJ16_06835 [Polaromonas sp.]|uniref:hypothetical protein n=1 Tax=Polaromonas sp. TaxID=1869339 RepID=UPI0017BCDD78|nr:hypothetical protein [Polaromonas sp.]NMM09971.1 hypothetical protein [Polaromonas sp.]
MTLKLSRAEVQAKYAPIPDPNWTPEVEAEFFARLSKATYRQAVNPDDEKAMLIREFATDILDAKRLNANYISTMAAVLGQFADADTEDTECLIARRNKQLGTPDTIRTIQAQMLSAGLLVKETRSQGHFFVGEVFVYRPRAVYRHRVATSAYLEKLYRVCEGESSTCPVPANIPPEDVPY